MIYYRVRHDWLECTGGRIEVDDGDLLVLSKGLEHAYDADPQRPWSIYWVHLEGFLTEDFLRPLSNTPRLCLGMQPYLLAEFNALLALHRQSLNLPYFIHAAYLLRGLFTPLAVRPARADLRFERVLDTDAAQTLMRAHLHDSLNLDKLVTQFRLSRFRFVETYRALTGRASIQDFIQIKMARACHLPDEGALEARQVVEQFDHTSPYCFSQPPRKVAGTAPSRYRVLRQG